MLEWLKLLRAWASVYSLRSFPNLVRLFRSQWIKGKRRILSVYLPSGRKLLVRMGTTDLQALEEIFRSKVYAGLIPLAPQYIFDMGANVGYSAVWFAEAFPQARIFAVEPDGGNCASCRLNTQYTDRIRVEQSALWSGKAGLHVDSRKPEWARTVSTDGPHEITGYSLSALIEMSGFPRIDLLKIDIEGAEAEVFRNFDTSLLDRIGAIAIELHGPECEAIFLSVMEGRIAGIEKSGAYWLVNLSVQGSMTA